MKFKKLIISLLLNLSLLPLYGEQVYAKCLIFKSSDAHELFDGQMDMNGIGITTIKGKGIIEKVLRYSKTNGKINILAKPNMICKNNEVASLNISTSPETGEHLKELKLSIKPTLFESPFIKLEINFETKNSLSEKRKVSTNITVSEGQSIVIKNDSPSFKVPIYLILLTERISKAR